MMALHQPQHRTPEAERELLLAARTGDERRRAELVTAFMPLIATVAQRYRSAHAVERKELMQEGVVGLLRALERYDPELGTPFWAYASWWVRQAMQQLVSELTWPVVLSDRALRQLARIKDAQRRLVQDHGREPSRAELAAETGLPAEHIGYLMAAERTPRALEEPVARVGDGGSAFGELLSDPAAQDPYDRVPGREAAGRIPDLLGMLSERERLIVREHFGLDGCERTLREIASGLGVSAERVRQVEHEALEKLRGVCDWEGTAA
jgi:RNA polymerase sigma factor (sigma-70 family)